MYSLFYILFTNLGKTFLEVTSYLKVLRWAFIQRAESKTCCTAPQVCEGSFTVNLLIRPVEDCRDCTSAAQLWKSESKAAALPSNKLLKRKLKNSWEGFKKTKLLSHERVILFWIILTKKDDHQEDLQNADSEPAFFRTRTPFLVLVLGGWGSGCVFSSQAGLLKGGAELWVHITPAAPLLYFLLDRKRTGRCSFGTRPEMNTD